MLHTPKRNILLIYADQWRPDQFGATRSYTPNLDALSAQGVTFENHFTQAIPCSPARASLYTGLYAPAHGVMTNRSPLDARHRTLGHHLRDCGYVPTLFGYTDTILAPDHPDFDPHNGSKYSVLPGMVAGCHQPDDNPREWLAHLSAQGHTFASREAAYQPDKSRKNGTGGVGGYPALYNAADSDTAFLTDRFLDWQDTQAPGWCAMVNFLRPHRPTIAPEPYNSRVDPFDLAAPIRAKTSAADADVHPYMDTLIRNGDAQRKVHEDLMGTIAAVDEVDWRSLRAIHLALMAEIDDCLGRMIAELKARREWENTLILFSSDHGEMMFDHHICQQASWHDQCARVPLVIHDPQCQETVAAGARIDALTEAIDLIPTLLELLGHDVPPALQGRSLAPFLRYETPTAWRDAVYWCFDYGGAVDQEYLDRFGIKRHDCLMSVIRTQTHKLAVFPGAEDVLVDLVADPHEMANLNGSKSYADVQAKLTEKLMASPAWSTQTS